MRKILLASAFALFGTFAMANEISNDSKNKNEESTLDELVEIKCMPIQLSCMEDCFFYDDEYPMTPMQFFAELVFQEAYVCGEN